MCILKNVALQYSLTVGTWTLGMSCVSSCFLGRRVLEQSPSFSFLAGSVMPFGLYILFLSWENMLDILLDYTSGKL